MKVLGLAILPVLMLVACSKNDDGGNTPPEPVPPVPVDTTKVDTLSYDARPTDWTVATEQDPALFMILVTKLTDAKWDSSSSSNIFNPSDDDLVAAFVNGECRGCAAPKKEYGIYRAYLTIHSTEDEPYSHPKVEIRYYSANLKHIFTAKDGLTYTNGECVGSVDNPKNFNWQK